ncbi:hypothetical protein ACFOKF_15490 [Sphingobium rhizovicinum]|uniref:Uncharacterized protein n=1 Tax=Sphingobium rhizovicinum TaxID=432308 RepID=A0ABV7NGG5_9SPHN
MTILTDILTAMYAAPTKPIGLVLGTSGWHAFHAARSYVDRDDEASRAFLIVINRLSFSRTNDFGGFDLILDQTPNNLGGGKQSAAA